MKIWILIFSAALFAGGTCLGVALQPRLAPTVKHEAKIDPAPQSGGDRHGHHFSVHRFISDLDLSSDQERDLDTILSETQEEMKALGRAMRAAQEKSRERIEGILSPEQKSKLDSLMATERQKRSESEIDRSVESYQKILTLTEDQAKAMRVALTDARRQRREGYKPGADYGQIRKAAREAQNKALKQAFTEEQFKRYIDVSELERSDR